MMSVLEVVQQVAAVPALVRLRSSSAIVYDVRGQCGPVLRLWCLPHLLHAVRSTEH